MNPFKQKRELLSSLKELKQNEKLIICPGCEQKFTKEQLAEGMYVCPSCGHHYNISAKYRLKTVLDPKSFREICGSIKGGNPLDFPEYDEKLAAQRKKTNLREAVITGTGKIQGTKTVICVMDNRFMMGSMGMAVGEKITRACEYATKNRLPLIIFCASGGARMQEGILSLFQMAKTGVTASFASLGDIILAEPKALIGFAGPRVIEQTIGESLPEGFQRAEYLKDHGFVDAIVPRKDLRAKLGLLLQIHDRRGRR